MDPIIDLWDRVKIQLKAEVDGQAFKDWIRPTFAVYQEDDLLKVSVPNQRFQQHLNEHYLQKIRVALEQLSGGKFTGVEFVTTSDETPAENYPKEKQSFLVSYPAPEKLQQEKDAADGPYISREDLQVLIERGERSGIPAAEVRAMINAVIRNIRRGAKVRSLLAVVTANMKERSAPENRTHFEEDNSQTAGKSVVVLQNPYPVRRTLTVVELLERPALILSRTRRVVIRSSFDGHMIQLERVGSRGMSPEIGAIFEWILSTGAKEGILEGDKYVFRVRNEELATLLGKTGKIYDTIHFHRLSQSLTCAFKLSTFAKRLSVSGKSHGVKKEYSIEAVIPVKGIKRSGGVITFFLDKIVIDTIRERQPREIRSIHESALMPLASLNQVEAGLVRWLSVNWHGNKYLHHPLRVNMADLHLYLIGSSLGNKNATVRKFRLHLRRAIDKINEIDLLLQFGIHDPRFISGRFEGDIALFYRCAGEALKVSAKTVSASVTT